MRRSSPTDPIVHKRKEGTPARYVAECRQVVNEIPFPRDMRSGKPRLKHAAVLYFDILGTRGMALANSISQETARRVGVGPPGVTNTLVSRADPRSSEGSRLRAYAVCTLEP